MNLSSLNLGPARPAAPGASMTGWGKAQTLSKGRGDQGDDAGELRSGRCCAAQNTAMAADSDLQAAVSARLHNMLENSE